jgi:gas vesicle protein
LRYKEIVSSGNGKAAKILEKVLDEVQERGAGGMEQAKAAVREADLSERLDRLLDFVESNASVIAAVLRRFAGEAADTARTAGGTAMEAVEHAATASQENVARGVQAGIGSAGEALDSLGDTLDEEVIRPTMRYGRGLRHGLLIGAVLALLFAPWPGEEMRAKLRAFGREATDLFAAIREGASAGPEQA